MKEKIINNSMKKLKIHIPSKFTRFKKESGSAMWGNNYGFYIIKDDTVFVDEIATDWMLAVSENYNNQYNGEYDNK
jgi:hypothetical protein